MKIIIAGSLGNISRPLSQELIQNGHELTIISHNPERITEIGKLGAKAAIGSVTDLSFLSQTLMGADAAYVMVPPNMGVIPTANAGKVFADAVQDSGVKRVVLLSSLGAERPEGTGPIAGLHPVERYFQEIPGLSLTIVRAGYFYINFYNDIPLIKNAGIIGSNYSGETLIPLVHPKDAAQSIAEELQQHPASNDVKYVVSDYRSARDIAQILGNEVGKDLTWVSFSDEQLQNGMTEAGVPEELAALFVEMGNALEENKLQEDFIAKGKPLAGKVKLEDFAREFEVKYSNT